MAEDRVESSTSFQDAADSFHEKHVPRWARDQFHQVSSRMLPSWASWIFWFILPSFVSNYFRPNSTARTKPMHDTAYLDGLRGVAAFVVYLHHTQLMYRFDSLLGYGSKPEANHVLQLPYVRIFVAGQASVALFFVISGYVLSLKTLSHIYQNQDEKILSTLSSSVLRRGVRLFLPFAAITLFLSFNAQTNLPLAIPYGDYRRGSFQEQMDYWWKVNAMTFNPLHSTDAPYAPTAFLGAAWTLPLEFTGSMIVFMLLLALARSKRWVHAVVVLLIGVYWPLSIGDSNSAYTALFCAGMLLAELAIVFPPATSSSSRRVSYFKGNSRSFRHSHQLVTILLFVLALYLLSAPQREMKSSVGFITISKYIPAAYDQDPGKFIIALGSILMTIVIMYAPTRAPTQNDALPREAIGMLEQQKHYDVANAPLLQRIFTSRVSQYLGRISYSLYLWHEPIKATVGSRYAQGAEALYVAYGPVAVTLDADGLRQFDRQYYWQYMGLLIPGIIWTTIWVIWVSDVFCRMVDEPSVRFARKMSLLMEKK